ncbi:COG0792 Predicted endonuclease distantly related to archaeal Holliday junction resolvase [Rhabdaerophilaceae bacterium]
MTRRDAYLFGLDAEYWAELLLRAKGYRILARRFLASGAEIDLVAKRGRTLVFIEVKARPSLEQAAHAISAQKLARIARAARAFLARLPAMPETVRCDAILIAPGHFPRHIQSIGELPLD